RAARGDAALAQQDSAIQICFQGILAKRVARCVNDGRSQNGHGSRTGLLACPGQARTPVLLAKNTRSGVAGLSSFTGPPNASIAFRSASRTEIASMSGGSPTALLPSTTSGSLARSMNSILNS